MSRDHDPRPAIRGVRVAQLRGGPTESLLEQSERVLKIEPA
jgi:hypothetical protein